MILGDGADFSSRNCAFWGQRKVEAGWILFNRMSMNLEDANDEILRDRPAFAQDVLEYERMVREAVSAGQLLTAIEMARDGLKRFGDSLMLRQQLALALAQTGALDAAREVLDEVLKQSASDEETLCLLGRVYKELWRRVSDPAVAADALHQACKCYGDAFAKNEGYYPGINLAFTLAALGKRGEAEDSARKVAKTCRALIAKADGPPDGWLFGTLGEAMTHQGATRDAGDFYRRASEAFKGRWRDLASMRRQAREILAFSAEQPDGSRGGWTDLAALRRRARLFFGRAEKGQEWLDRCFEFPSVVVFVGHMVDAPGRATPRFPAEREPQIREEIRRQLGAVKAGYGYSSAACGGDIIFCECLLEMDAKVNLVLPCPVDAFERQSVSFAGPEWVRRFHNVIGNATTLLIANPAEYATAVADPALAMGFVYANRIVTGLAVLQTEALDLELHAIALWDGKPGDGAGGTSSVVAEWQQRQLTAHVVAPNGPAVVTAPPAGPEPAAPPVPAGPTGEILGTPASPPPIRQEIKAMLSAEVINYRKIAERQMPAFVREFKGAIARLIAGLPAAPALAESWGKSHHFVFDGLQDAALFALDLRDLVVQTRWSERGLPADLGIRIVLHAGPVFAFPDPVLQRTSCIGSHMTRAGYIEPITPPGQVYVSQEFAALCGAERAELVGFEFLGRLPMARLFDDAPLYRLDRRSQKKK